VHKSTRRSVVFSERARRDELRRAQQFAQREKALIFTANVYNFSHETGSLRSETDYDEYYM
jgi:hypothetical protein